MTTITTVAASAAYRASCSSVSKLVGAHALACNILSTLFIQVAAVASVASEVWLHNAEERILATQSEVAKCEAQLTDAVLRHWESYPDCQSFLFLAICRNSNHQKA